jgi:hypothetical protein
VGVWFRRSWTTEESILLPNLEIYPNPSQCWRGKCSQTVAVEVSNCF